MTRSAAGSAASCHTDVAATENEASITADAIPPDTVFDRRFPKKALIRKPRNGNRGMSASTVCLGASPLQGRKRVRVERLAVPEQRDDDREPHRRFGGRYGHD